MALFASNLGVELAHASVIATRLILFWKIQATRAYGKIRIAMSIIIIIVARLGAFTARLIW